MTASEMSKEAINALNEIVIGLPLLLGSAFRDAKGNTVLILFLLLSSYYLIQRVKKRQRARIIGEWVIVASIILLCISVSVNTYLKFSYGYGGINRGIRALDLECNYSGAFEDDLYSSTMGDRSKWINDYPAVFTPPAFAAIRLSTHILGDRYDKYVVNYRKTSLLFVGLILAMNLGFAYKQIGRTSLDGRVLIAFFISTFLFLLFFAVMDIILGNTNIFVGALVAAQLFLSSWKNPKSKFLQGFLLALAWWIKPNIMLVIWCLVVFSISKKQYEYLLGLFLGFAVPILVSLSSANITLETYLIYFTKIAGILELDGLGRTANLSIFSLVGHPVIACRISLVLLALFVLFFTLRAKHVDFVKYEILAFTVAFLPWTRFWDVYLIPFVIIMWVNIVIRIKEGKPVYLETAFVLLLPWIRFTDYRIIGVNLMLLTYAMLYAWQYVDFQPAGSALKRAT